jgi:hypothetical protein
MSDETTTPAAGAPLEPPAEGGGLSGLLGKFAGGSRHAEAEGFKPSAQHDAMVAALNDLNTRLEKLETVTTPDRGMGNVVDRHTVDLWVRNCLIQLGQAIGISIPAMPQGHLVTGQLAPPPQSPAKVTSAGVELAESSPDAMVTDEDISVYG